MAMAHCHRGGGGAAIRIVMQMLPKRLRYKSAMCHAAKKGEHRRTAFVAANHRRGGMGGGGRSVPQRRRSLVSLVHRSAVCCNRRRRIVGGQGVANEMREREEKGTGDERVSWRVGRINGH